MAGLSNSAYLLSAYSAYPHTENPALLLHTPRQGAGNSVVHWLQYGSLLTDRDDGAIAETSASSFSSMRTSNLPIRGYSGMVIRLSNL